MSWMSALADDATPTPAASDNAAAPATPDNATPAPAATSAAPNNAAAATDASATTEPSETAEAQPTNLADLVDTFWHYGKIARYDLAVDAGRKILASGADSNAILVAFENVVARHNDAIDVWMLRWRSLPLSDATDRASVQAMRGIASKLNDIINEGYATRRNDPNYIRKTIAEMATSSRAYDDNMPRLAESGEVAVKIIVDILRDPAQVDLYATCRRALRDLGRKALNPLLAATEMKDYNTLVDVISALGDIGYEASIPYLARLAEDPDVPDAIHIASRKALIQIGVARDASLQPSPLFYALAEKFYYGKSDIEPAGDKTSDIWYWTSDLGLTRKLVPTPIFNDLLAMRAAEYAMKLDASNGLAVSLWLDANTKREADLPAGAVDLTHKGDPDANYYNVSAGADFLNAALARATRDRNAAVALKLCESLRNITGQANLGGNAVTPLMQALYFPNRQVRYAAAFALAQSLPSKPFAGSDRVVPLLVEAVNQTNKPGIVVVAPATGSADTITAADLRDAVQSLGYPVVAASSPTDAADAAISLPTVELIIISEDSDVRKMIDLEQNIARLQGASMLVLTHIVDSPYAVASATDLLMNAAVMPAKASLKDEIKIDIDSARQHSGTAVMSEADAAQYSLQAARLLEKLAITRGHALDVSVAEAGLLTALNDSRPEIAKAAGNVLGTLRSKSAQNGLAMKANNESTPTEVRVSLYQSLAESAKYIGNRLGGNEIAALEKVVSTNTDSGVRDAAAEARGALNLPADQARTLILKQSRL
ncbi:MAG TPA: hypothetical protein VHX86_15805 [Tepidisphaeraceae bacterium]|nr:hypothetical protein [Tepidisphaeraceae bacterium]